MSHLSLLVGKKQSSLRVGLHSSLGVHPEALHNLCCLHFSGMRQESGVADYP